MPNVTIFAPASHLAADDAAHDGFIADCTDACTGILRADLRAVHIIFVPALERFSGQDAYVEVKLRATPHRTPSVVGDYMEAVEAMFRRHFGLTPRIRCFAYEADMIFARN